MAYNKPKMAYSRNPFLETTERDWRERLERERDWRERLARYKRWIFGRWPR